jgi:hypothetical protein
MRWIRLNALASGRARDRRGSPCADQGSIEPIPKRDPDGVSSARSETWTQCSGAAWCSTVGGGHRITHRDDRRRPVIDLLLGVQNRDFDGIEAI